MTRSAGRASRSRWTRTGSSAATGSMFPVSYTSTPIDMPDGPGVVVAFKDIEEQREAEQALREREAILATVGQPVWVADHRGRFHYANPAALAALGFSEPLGAGRQAGPRHGPLQVPRRVAVPRGGLPARPGAQGGGDAAGRRGLARAQGRLDRARHLLVGAVRPARRAGLGDRVHRRRGAAPRPSRRRASATSRRRGRRSCGPRGGGSSRPPTRRGRSSSATCTTAPSSSSSARMLQLQLAERRAASDPDGGARAARAGDRAGGRRRRRAAPAGRRDPPGDPHRPRPRPGGGVARLAAAAARDRRRGRPTSGCRARSRPASTSSSPRR